MTETLPPIAQTLIDPADGPARNTEKLLRIVEVLMRQVEQASDNRGEAYVQFQRAAMLEDRVRQRTRDLEHTLSLLNESNARLAEATRAAETARQNLADAIETVQEGFALFDPDERMVLCNSRFCMPIADIRDRLHPGMSFADYVELVSRSDYLALPVGETPEGWAVSRMQRHLQRQVFNVQLVGDVWLQVSEQRTRDGGTVVLQTDVTDIIRLEREERGKMLDDQARIIRATLDHINQGVCIFDARLNLAGWNSRLGQLLAIPVTLLRIGTSFDSVLRRMAPEISFGSHMTGARLDSWARQGQPRPPLSFEIRRGGMTLDVFAQEMPDRGFVMSFTDITSEREAVEAITRANETLEARVVERTLDLEDALANAERANSARVRFVAAASHDLLQPLSAAKLFIASAMDDAVNPRVRGTLDKAQKAMVSVEGILAALLDISRLESGAASVEVTAVPLGPLLEQLTDEFAPLAARKGLELRILPCRVAVSSDAVYLRRILQNLIGNAIRYTDRGRVLVGVRRTGGALRVEVRDTGPGIPESEQQAIFREFHRVNGSASASEGMGLGLAIVERACALLGHALTLASVPGQGTCFGIRLEPAAFVPVILPPPARSFAGLPLAGLVPDGLLPDHLGAALRMGADADPASDRIALLVENDDGLRRAMCDLLERNGVTVFDVGSGEEAIDLVEETGIIPDVLLLDQQLGEGLMTGVETFARLREKFGARPARIITADRSVEVREACRAAGVELMHKPIDAAALEAFLATSAAAI